MNLVDIINDCISEFFINEDMRYDLAGFGYDDEIIDLDYAYHVSPASSENSIYQEGIKPNKSSPNEPNVVYLSADIFGVLKIAKLLNASKNIKNEDWIIYRLDTKDIPLYKDPHSVGERGVYTYDTINPNRIQNKTIIDSEILRTQKNWGLFWNWFKWNKPKPNFVKRFTEI